MRSVHNSNSSYMHKNIKPLLEHLKTGGFHPGMHSVPKIKLIIVFAQ